VHGFREGRGRINEIEAEEIASLVMSCLEDPDYSGSQLGLLQYNGILYYRISDVIFSAIVLWRERIVHRLCTPLDKVSYGL
jgi:hypothetical protein